MYQQFRHSDWQGVIHENASADAASGIVDEVLTAPGEVLAQRDTITTRAIECRLGRCVVRHDTAPRWRPYRKSLVMHTAAVHQEMAAAGIRVPTVLLACRRIKGPAEELLAAEMIEGRSLTADLRQLRLTDGDPLPLFRRIGREIADLHRAGFMHGDLIPGNILLPDDDGPFVYIDNERTRRLPRVFLSIGRRRNLTQMYFRLLKGFAYKDLRQLFKAYYDRVGVSKAEQRRDMIEIVRKGRARLARRQED